MKKIFYILILLVSCCKISFSQISIERQVIGSTGNLTNTGSILATSNVGETVIPTFSQSTLIVTQGFEQPYPWPIVGINSINFPKINIFIYPNPTTNEVFLDFSLNQSMEIEIDIYNETGQQMKNPLQTTVQNNCKQELDFSNFTAGNYFVVIKSTDGKLLKGFKVQKLN